MAHKEYGNGLKLANSNPKYPNVLTLPNMKATPYGIPKHIDPIHPVLNQIF